MVKDFERGRHKPPPRRERRMKKTLFNRARDIQGGVLESRMVARMETEGRELTDQETREECEYLLETVDYSGYDKEYISSIKRACRYILSRREGA